MIGSASLTPLPFVIVIVLILVWQVLGRIGADHYLLHWIGAPWRIPPANTGQVAADPTLVLMVWANEGGAGENTARE